MRPALDLAVLTELTGCDDPAMVAEFLDDFRQVASQAALSLQAAAQAGDARTLEAVAHSVKSSAHYAGAMPLCEASEQLELAAQAGESARLPQLTQAWQTEWQRVAACLSQQLDVGG